MCILILKGAYHEGMTYSRNTVVSIPLHVGDNEAGSIHKIHDSAPFEILKIIQGIESQAEQGLFTGPKMTYIFWGGSQVVSVPWISRSERGILMIILLALSMDTGIS